MKQSFIVYTDNIEYLEELSDAQIGQLYKAQIAYSRGEYPEITDPMVRFAFKVIKGQMDRDNAKWQETCKARSEAGKKGAGKRWQDVANDSNCHQEITNVAENENETENDIKEISSNEDTKKAPAEPPAPKKTKFGTYKHVMMTEKEHAQLIADYGASNATAAIEYMDEYIERKGYKTKSHYLAIRKWVFDAMKEDQIKAEELKQREERLNNKSSPAYEAKQRRSDAKRGMERDVNYDAKMVDELIRSIK